MGKPTPSSITKPAGFRAAGVTCGIKPSGAPDLALIAADRPCSAAAVFTRNKVQGAPVQVSKRHVRRGAARAIVCNSGISNVATGEAGLANAKQMCQWTADHLGVNATDVLVCSTGVIGVPLPMAKIRRGIDEAATTLARGRDTDAAAARAILTTDLTAKSAMRSLQLRTRPVTIAGVCKGSGMIAPNLATMLAFLTTDANIDARLLREALRDAVADSFNRVTVDSDTSTSDSVMVLASGAAGGRVIDERGKEFDRFAQALTEVCRDLAYQLVRDGEGATKVFRVQVVSAASLKDADRVGRAVANSPLVKTAVHGGDPNWGRLAMAVGKSGAKVKLEQLSLSIGGHDVMVRGTPVDLTAARVRKLETAMAKREVTLGIDLGYAGPGCEWLGCDLSKEYITINAEYTT